MLFFIMMEVFSRILKRIEGVDSLIKKKIESGGSRLTLRFQS